MLFATDEEDKANLYVLHLTGAFTPLSVILENINEIIDSRFKLKNTITIPMPGKYSALYRRDP